MTAKFFRNSLRIHDEFLNEKEMVALDKNFPTYTLEENKNSSFLLVWLYASRMFDHAGNFRISPPQLYLQQT
jgi:hypothetical protein